MAHASPSCGIDWSLLAGIGRVESNHGRFGGAVLNAGGTSTPPIIGPALNGGQFAYIGDTDHGAFDGDARYDHAVGPMQFIPSTWRSYGIDADGNGVADALNINDAALAAAHYLCGAGADLRTAAGQRRAVLAYNHSDSYVAEVLALAAAYGSGIPVSDLPLSGNLTGAVPDPSGDYAAPAAPGPAIGAADTTPASGDTVGQAPPPAGAPAGNGDPSGDGGTPPADTGTTPAVGSSPSSGGSRTTGGGGRTTRGGGTTSGATTSTGGTSGGQQAPDPVPAPVPVPAPDPVPPVQVPAPPVQVPPAPLSPPASTPVTCGLPTQPLCPSA